MKVKIWGCRGSLPSPGPEKVIYGGNTSCVEIRNENTVLVLDGGSGIIRMAESLDAGNKIINILLTHLHMDHIIGLGFFKAMYNPDMTINIWGPAATSESLTHRLRRYFSPPIFPVRLNELPCTLNIHEVDDSEFKIGNLKISSEYICHPGPTVGYRITLNEKTVAYIPDHEPALGSNNFPKNAEWTSGYNLAKDVDLLLHDAQYKKDEYVSRVGWGHCTMTDAIDFAEMANAKKILFFHHDPAHTDNQLKQLFIDSLKGRNNKTEVELAEEGRTYII